MDKRKLIPVQTTPEMDTQLQAIPNGLRSEFIRLCIAAQAGTDDERKKAMEEIAWIMSKPK